MTSLLGLPKSADSQRWEITAKLPSSGEGAPQVINGRPLPPPFSIGLEMLRGLLVDRFELKTHIENREATVYAIYAQRRQAETRPGRRFGTCRLQAGPQCLETGNEHYRDDRV